MICYHVLNNFLAILEELLGLLALVYKSSKYNSTYLSQKKRRGKDWLHLSISIKISRRRGTNL